MDLTGHHSNPSRPLEALLEGHSDTGIDTVRRNDRAHDSDAEPIRPPIRRRHRRHDWVLDAVIRVLADRHEPMQPREVHAAAEALLGVPVRWGSVKKCLSSNIVGTSPRFVRVARGRYAASAALIDACANAPRRKQA